MIIEKFVLSRTAPRNKHVGWIDTSGDEPKIKFNVSGQWSEEYDPEQVQVDWNCVDTTSKAFIKNKPTIPAAQIQSDWTQSDNTALDYIKNKPSVPAQPLIVEGTLTAKSGVEDSFYFSPSQGEADLDTAYAAFDAGTLVILKVMDDDPEQAAAGSHRSYRIGFGYNTITSKVLLYDSPDEVVSWSND